MSRSQVDANPRARRDPLLQRNRELAILNTIAEALNRSVDMDTALRGALALVTDLLGLRTAWIWLLDEQGQEFYLAAAQNLPPFLKDDPTRMTGRCYCLDSFCEGDLTGAANVNVLSCSRLRKAFQDPYHGEGTEGLQYHTSIPLYANQKSLGVLNVASPDWRSLDADELRLLYTIGYQLGIAIERARLHAQSARLATLEERNRLAREIHDTLAQGLTAIALQLEAAQALLSTDPVRAESKLAQALALTRGSLEEARRSVMDLRAPQLQNQTLRSALTALAESIAKENGWQTSYRFESLPDHLPARIEAGLYRIAQEALTNVSKHAQATAVLIELWRDGDFVVLEVEDDGIGFEPEAVPANGHFGLVGLRERAHLLGGVLKIASTRGEGTCLEVRVPLGRRKDEG